jgi:hypothetical protein
MENTSKLAKADLIRNICLIPLFVMLSLQLGRAESGFNVTGRYQAFHYQTNGTRILAQTVPFLVTAKEQGWLVRLEYGSNWFHYFGSNGTNVFSVVYDPKQTNIALPGSIGEDAYPADGGPHISLLWLAFCSAGALDAGATSNLPAPWCIARQTPIAYLYRCETEHFQEKPRLLSLVRYFTDKTHAANAGKGKYLRRESLTQEERYKRDIAYQSMFMMGRLAGEYGVETTTNVGGFRVPTHCAVRMYDHLSKKGNIIDTNALKVLYEIRVESASALEINGNLLPPLDRKADTVDYRFKSPSPVDSITYSITNWPELILPAMNQLLQSKSIKSAVNGAPHLDSKRIVSLALLSIVAFLPVVVLIWNRRQHQKQK